MRAPLLLSLLFFTSAACAPAAPAAPASPVDVAPVSSARPGVVEERPDGRVKLPSMGAADKLASEGRVYRERGEYAAALDRFENAYRISPSDEVLYDIGSTLERMGKKREAANVFEKLLQGDLSPTDRSSLELRIQQLRAGS